MKKARRVGLFVLVMTHLFATVLTVTAESAYVPRRIASVLTVPKTQVPPVLDGRLNDVAWAAAQPLRDWAYKKGVQQQTEVYLTRDDKNIYLAARCFEDNPGNLVSENKDQLLWKNDCIELYIVPEKNLKLFAHLVVDCEGRSTGAAWMLDEWGESVEGKKIPMQCKTGREEGAWILEVAVPIDSFGLPLSADKKWAFGANRERWAVSPEASSFQGGFNRPLEYPDLVFEDRDVVFDGIGVKNRSKTPQVAAIKMGCGEKTISENITLNPGETRTLDWKSLTESMKEGTAFSIELSDVHGNLKGREEYTLVPAATALKVVKTDNTENPVFRESVLDDPAFFPVCVWLQPATPQIVREYKEMGVNIFYGGIESYATRDQKWLDAIGNAGMYAFIPLKNAYISNELYKHPAVIGWHTQDEPDLPQKEYNGGPLPPAVLQNLLARARSLPVQLPVFLNMSCGVGDDRFVGRAASFGLFPDYCKSADRIGFDHYPCNSLGADGPERFCTIAKGMDRLAKFSDGKKKLGFCMEANKFTKANTPDSRAPTPEEVKSQMWIALTHRAQHIMIFCHSFAGRETKPDGIEPAMQAALKGMLSEVHKLAPVLNAPFLPPTRCATVKNTLGSRVDCLTKEYAGDIYLICANMYKRAEKPEITVPGVTGGSAEVLFEDRTVSVSNGKIIDDFEPYGIHRYKISGK